MNLLQIEDLQWAHIIILILIVFSILIRIAKYKGGERESKEIIKKLENEFPSLDEFLKKNNSFENISKSLNETQGIPEIITIRYLTILAEETITNGILSDIKSHDKQNFKNRLLLLNNVSKEFRTSMPDKNNAILEVNEKRNIFYISKHVAAAMKGPNGEFFLDIGMLILGLHYLMFFPSSALKDYVDFRNLEEMLIKVTDKIPLLNIGISTISVVNQIGESAQEEKPIFTDSLKEKFLTLLNENKAFLLKYYDIEKVQCSSVEKRIIGIGKLSITLENSFTYSFWKVKDKKDFIDTMFEGTLSLALMNGNLILAKGFNEKNNFISVHKVS